MTFMPLKTVISAFQASVAGASNESCGFAVADLRVELPVEVAVVSGDVLVKLASSAEPIDPAVLTKVTFTLGATCTPEPTVSAPPSPWTQIPSGTAVSLHGAWSEAGSAWVVVVGESGTVLTSSDGGSSFSAVALGTTARLSCVAKLQNSVVVAGELGTAWFHDPASGSWLASNVATNGHIHALATVGGLFVGVGAAGTIVSSANGGADFDLLGSFTPESLDAVVATPVGHLWAAGGKGTVLISQDATTWSAVAPVGPHHWYALSPLPKGVIVAGEAGKLAIYGPGGGALVDSGTTDHLYAVHVLETGGILAVGRNGAAVWAKDGATFQPLPTPTTESLHAISSLGGGKLLVAGTGGALFRLDTHLL